jgi:tetratricopeptide (TPR) repeat protein
MRYPFFLFALLPFFSAAQNTLDGQAKIVPEAEVERQSAFVEAESARMLGKYAKAVELYKKFVYDAPRNDAAWYGLARAYTAQNELINALEAVGRAAALAPANEWYSTFQADLYEKTGRAKDAVAIYEALTKRNPQSPNYWEHLSYLLALSGDPQGSLKALDRLERLTGISETTAEKKHLVYVALRDNRKAALELQRLADAFPLQPEYRRQLAQFYEEIGDQAAAQRVYADILRRNPDDPDARLAAMERPKGTSDATHLQALQPLFRDRNIDIDGKIKELLPYLAKMSNTSDAGLLDQLLQLSQLLETAHPDDPKSWSVAGAILYQARRPAEALEKYRQCIRLNPATFAAWDNALSILQEQQNYTEMLRVGEQAIDAFPNQAKAYYYYGLAATEKEQPDVAIDALEQATLMANDPNLWLEIMDQLGIALTRKKDYPAAQKRFEQAVSKGGDRHPGILEHYGDALFQGGDRSKGLEYWQKAYALRKSAALEQKISSAKAN